jgi:riboflavin synthase
MFTGIIEATGEITGLEQVGGDLRAEITSDALDFSDVAIGDSICVSGVCLTVVTLAGNSFTVDISNETVSLTSFATLKTGARVNLEKAMQPSSRFGGHIVSGHVDGLAELVSRKTDGRSERLDFKAPAQLKKYIAAKGSVCLEGISLTVNAVTGDHFGVNIIPHTAQVTTFGELKPGDRVNLEVDIISRYLERLVTGDAENTEPHVTMDQLVRCGFADSPGNKK